MQTIKVDGYRLYPVPAKMRPDCIRAQARVPFGILCPTILPRSQHGPRLNIYAGWPDFPKLIRPPWVAVGAFYGTSADPYDWSLNNPLFLHFFLAEGKLPAWLLEIGVKDNPQKLIGPRTIAGHRGRLYEQVSFDTCGCTLGGDLTFIWHANGITYEASLHRWSPKPKPTLGVLAAIIAHLQPVN